MIKYNWQLSDWPQFTYNQAKIDRYEKIFLQQSGVRMGLERGIPLQELDSIRINFLSEEAYRTSEIEGELLNRDSIQSSIKKHFGLTVKNLSKYPKEYGVAEMTVNVHKTYASPLTEETLHLWHSMLMNGRRDLELIGGFRIHEDPMQIVSGRIDRSIVYFEAPPSSQVSLEMNRFIDWFNQSEGKLPLLIRAGISHIYFETIHPYEDGNGRIGRALVEKVIAQELEIPSLILLSKCIQKNRKAYYDALNKASFSNEITQWLIYFARLILDALELTKIELEFILRKIHVFNQYADVLNQRQEKVLRRLFEAGPEGFIGGLSPKNYRTITKASPATTTRDLNSLVELGIFEKTGNFKSVRYRIKG